MIKNINDTDMTERNHYDIYRKATKISIICDNNNIPISSKFYPANIHDTKTIESSIDNIKCSIRKNNRLHNYLIGDKGYIINKTNRIKLNNKYKINLITPHIKNQQDKLRKYFNNKLKTRYKIEHVFCSLDKFERLRFRYDRYLKFYESFHFFALISITYIKI